LLASPERDHLRVVLVSTRNPLNIGAAARAMSNFGFSNLRVVHPYESAFREARSAVGASALLAHAAEHDSVASAAGDCSLVVGTTAVRHRHLHHRVRRLEDGARLIRRRLRTGRVALLFGSEKFGLSNDDLSHCHWLMRIPTHQDNISMNLGQAVAVSLYELIRDAKSARVPEKSPLAPAAEVERITAMLAETLRESGFLDRRRVADADLRIRRLVRRLRLPQQDAVMWLGIFRQIVWKLQHPALSDPARER
jgi:TrmH family RNA methyltransferase